MPEGTVRWFDAERGFGFLALSDGGEDLFVHASEIVGDGGARLLREGQAVEFEVGEGDRGPQARQVRVTGDAAPGTPLGVLGTVAWYEPAKGYGFVTPDDGGPEIFVHSSAVVGGGVVSEGQRVAFMVGEGERGPQAEHLLPLGDVGAPAPGAAAPQAVDDGADGTVAWFEEGKGFGFITPDAGGEDVFVHARALTGGMTWLSEGDRVSYGTVQGDKGPQARDVRLARGGGAAPRSSAGPSSSRSSSPRTSGRTDAPRSAAGRSSGPRGGGAPARGGEGVVARYDADRGFGFITPDAGGADLFVHVSVLSGDASLQPGDRVRYTVRQSDRGPQADRVERT